MPRTSNRVKKIKQLSSLVQRRKIGKIFRFLFNNHDEEEDMIDSILNVNLQSTLSSRYSVPRRYRNRKTFDWEDCLSDDSLHFNDEEFLATFRVTRPAFHKLVGLLKDHPIFNKKSKKKSRPVTHQFLVFMYMLGKEGHESGQRAVSTFFGIGKGTSENYNHNITTALKSMEPEVVAWPDEEEREKIRARLAHTGFRHCIGLIDGTLFVLALRPGLHGECYHSR